MKKILAAILVMMTIIVLALTGCNAAQTTTAPLTTLPPATAPITPTPSSTTQPALDAVDNLVIDFIKNTATFKFDGIQDSITFTKTEFSPISSFPASEYTVKFQTAHPGHGDRSGMMLAQVITGHTARIYYDQAQKYVRIAACDDTWDLIKNQELPKSISGIVISGGDTARPDGPLDVPHTFLYQVRQEDGSLINVSYRSYPPSPAGDAARAKIFLEFYAGSIQIGDRIYATGMLDKATNTIVIAEDGGYIRTEIPKMQVVGQVISGGEVTPEGLLDAPRKFLYTVQKDDNSTVNITYTAYPPSPAGDINNAKISLTFYAGTVKIGDYMLAYGTYDLPTNTILVAVVGDLIKTYPVKP